MQAADDHEQVMRANPSVITYCLKIINPNNTGGELIINDLPTKVVYSSVDSFKAKLCEVSQQYTEGYDTVFGFIAPGHGFKGKQEKITTDAELADMYRIHKTKKRIMLWLKCKPVSEVRKRKEHPQDGSEASVAKRQAHDSIVKIMNAVDTIVENLKLKHGEKYTPVQLNCWAHMIHTKKHDSLDTPPSKPFFGKKKTADSASGSGSSLSPSKRISLRSECMSQLDKWHQLSKI